MDVGYLVWTDVSRARTEKFPLIHIVRPPLIELVEARGFLVYCKRCQLSLHQFHSVLKYNRSQTVWVVYFISWVFSENLFLSYAVCGRSWLLLLFFASSLRVFFLFSRSRFAAQRISYFFRLPPCAADQGPPLFCRAESSFLGKILVESPANDEKKSKPLFLRQQRASKLSRTGCIF